MATEVRHRRGTTAQHATFVGALGEVTVDTDKKVTVIHDGVTAGGFPSTSQTIVNGKASSGANSDITSLSGLTTPLSIAQGGTGANSAVNARTALSAAKTGANSDITSLTALTAGGLPDNSVLTADIADAQVTPAKMSTAAQPIGVGQTYQNVFGSRALATNYTNSTGRTITVFISGYTNTASSALTATIGGVTVPLAYSQSNGSGSVFRGTQGSFFVPDGQTYRVDLANAMALDHWVELR